MSDVFLKAFGIQPSVVTKISVRPMNAHEKSLFAHCQVPKECFDNCFSATQLAEGYDYCLRFIHGFIEHAWLRDPDGHYIDITLDHAHDAHDYQLIHAFTSIEMWNAINHMLEVEGVAYPPQFHLLKSDRRYRWIFTTGNQAVA